jgi:2-keto-4-pentenoate hydratase/2-oxohepta-3-ene-1,7-dioic acid hydratase in catechol pathway
MAKITRYMTTEGSRYGLVDADKMVYILGVDPFTTPVQEWQMGDIIGPADDLLLTPPVSPSKIICVGRNYAEHVAERNAEIPTSPMLFLKPPSAMTAFDTPIVIPMDVGRIDLEGELAIVIGKQARHVKQAQALDYVFGYTCANDISARELQTSDKQWGRAKGFDTFCPIGPWISTDIADPTELRIQTRLNGVTVQDSNTQHMIFSVPYLIEFISHVMTLEVGDVILTGTPAGVSPLKPDDMVEIEIEGIGVLRNWVEAAH